MGDPSLHTIVQAKFDLDDILDNPSSSRQARASAEMLLKQLTEYFVLENNPKVDFDLAIRIWKNTCR